MSAYTFIDVKLTNDLSGTLKDPFVVSIENVQTGVLRPENGGLGVSNIPSGSLIIGNDTDAVEFLTGSTDNDLVVWSTDELKWTSRNFDIIKSLEISSSENPIFSIDDNSIGSDKKYNITFNSNPSGMFLATPSESAGIFQARKIDQSDLPSYYENIEIINSTFSGTFSGIVNFSNIISGDGSGLNSLSINQIDDFYDGVLDIVASTSFLYDNFYQNMDARQIPFIEEKITSSFSGGYGINISGNVISATGSVYTFLPNSNKIIVTSGSNNDFYFDLNDNIDLQQITASSLYASELFADNFNIQNTNIEILSSSNIFCDNIVGILKGQVIGDVSGSGQNLSEIPNSALINDYIIINNSTIKLGESITIPGGVSNITSSDENIIIIDSGSNKSISLNQNSVLNSISSSTINSENIYASFLHGDGANITNLNFQNILDADIQNLTTFAVSSSEIITNNLSCSSIQANYFIGNGYYLTDINAENIQNLYSFLNNVITSSKNISVTNTLSGTNLSVELELDENIQISTITASFSGDGSKISNIQSPLIKIFNGSGFSVGDVVSYTVSGLVKSNNLNNYSNIVGVVSGISGSVIYVQVDGESYINHQINNAQIGNTAYLGNDGKAINYVDIPNNSYAVELGNFTDANKIILNIKKKWKVKL